MTLLAILAALLACAGIAQCIGGYLAVRHFAARPALPGATRPPVTVLKPLHGDEPLLEQALASLFRQEYGPYQIVFGVQNPADPALAVVARLHARFPDQDMAVVVDPTGHGINRKVGNLINMLPQARHDVLVIADSDVHCTPDYLGQIVATLARPGTGLATLVYGGVAASAGLAGALGASWINHCVAPGVLMARALGRQDGLGATLALRRDTLAAVGGLPALVDHLADDHVLGRLVIRQGLTIGMAHTLAATTVPETGLGELFRHELRWGRTILAVAPVGYALSAIQFVLFWALAAVLLSGCADWAGALFLFAWLTRAAVAAGIDNRLGLVQSGLASCVPIWLLPLRDLLSMTIMLVSYADDRVVWRGQVMRAPRDDIDDRLAPRERGDDPLPAPTAAAPVSAAQGSA